MPLRNPKLTEQKEIKYLISKLVVVWYFCVKRSIVIFGKKRLTFHILKMHFNQPQPNQQQLALTNFEHLNIEHTHTHSQTERTNFSIKNIIIFYRFLNWLMDWHEAWIALLYKYNIGCWNWFCQSESMLFDIGFDCPSAIRSSSHTK